MKLIRAELPSGSYSPPEGWRTRELDSAVEEVWDVLYGPRPGRRGRGAVEVEGRCGLYLIDRDFASGDLRTRTLAGREPPDPQVLTPGFWLLGAGRPGRALALPDHADEIASLRQHAERLQGIARDLRTLEDDQRSALPDAVGHERLKRSVGLLIDRERNRVVGDLERDRELSRILDLLTATNADPGAHAPSDRLKAIAAAWREARSGLTPITRLARLRRLYPALGSIVIGAGGVAVAGQSFGLPAWTLGGGLSAAALLGWIGWNEINLRRRGRAASEREESLAAEAEAALFRARVPEPDGGLDPERLEEAADALERRDRLRAVREALVSQQIEPARRRAMAGKVQALEEGLAPEIRRELAQHFEREPLLALPGLLDRLDEDLKGQLQRETARAREHGEWAGAAEALDEEARLATERADELGKAMRAVELVRAGGDVERSALGLWSEASRALSLRDDARRESAEGVTLQASASTGTSAEVQASTTEEASTPTAGRGQRASRTIESASTEETLELRPLQPSALSPAAPSTLVRRGDPLTTPLPALDREGEEAGFGHEAPFTDLVDDEASLVNLESPLPAPSVPDELEDGWADLERAIDMMAQPLSEPGPIWTEEESAAASSTQQSAGRSAEPLEVTAEHSAPDTLEAPTQAAETLIEASAAETVALPAPALAPEVDREFAAPLAKDNSSEVAAWLDLPAPRLLPEAARQWSLLGLGGGSEDDSDALPQEWPVPVRPFLQLPELRMPTRRPLPSVSIANALELVKGFDEAARNKDAIPLAQPAEQASPQERKLQVEVAAAPERAETSDGADTEVDAEREATQEQEGPTRSWMAAGLDRISRLWASDPEPESPTDLDAPPVRSAPESAPAREEQAVAARVSPAPRRSLHPKLAPLEASPETQPRKPQPEAEQELALEMEAAPEAFSFEDGAASLRTARPERTAPQDAAPARPQLRVGTNRDDTQRSHPDPLADLPFAPRAGPLAPASERDERGASERWSRSASARSGSALDRALADLPSPEATLGGTAESLPLEAAPAPPAVGRPDAIKHFRRNSQAAAPATSSLSAATSDRVRIAPLSNAETPDGGPAKEPVEAALEEMARWRRERQAARRSSPQ